MNVWEAPGTPGGSASVPRLIFSLLLDFPESGKNLGKSGQTCKIRLALKKNLEGVRQNPENLAQVHSFLAENAENEVSQSILKFGVDNPNGSVLCRTLESFHQSH